MTKNEELSRIIKQIKNDYHLTQAEIAERIGISKQYLSDTINGRYPFSNELRTKITRTFLSNVLPINDEQPEYFTGNTHGNRYYKRSDGQLFIEAPLVQYSALGSLADDNAELSADVDQKVVRFEVDKIGHGKYFAFEVDGDSMDDGSRISFERGDIVLVRELDKADWQPRLHIGQWRFWVVVWQNCVRLKEIVAQDGETITLHSLNPSPEYTDFSLDLGNVAHLFNVIKKQPKVVQY